MNEIMKKIILEYYFIILFVSFMEGIDFIP